MGEKYNEAKDNEKAMRARESQEYYSKLLERLKEKALTENQRERLEQVEEEVAKSDRDETSIIYKRRKK